jgi:protein O-GlcNAc transferase
MIENLKHRYNQLISRDSGFRRLRVIAGFALSNLRKARRAFEKTNEMFLLFVIDGDGNLALRQNTRVRSPAFFDDELFSEMLERMDEADTFSFKDHHNNFRSNTSLRYAHIVSTANARLRNGAPAEAACHLCQQFLSTGDPMLGVALFELLSALSKDEPAIHVLRIVGRGSLNARLRLAEIFEKRGLIDEAIELWKESIGELTGAQYSFMLQCMLKSPTITSSELLEEQLQWAEKFCGANGLTAARGFRKGAGTHKVRIGYHCSFWNSSTIRNQLLPVLSQHDRERFEIFAYSPAPLEECFLPHLDLQRQVGELSDEEFAQLVRRDGVDVLLECTGFSPGHRFAAMALRCAPVQVSYLNHTGTSGVKNVDYVIADETAFRKEEERFFSEQVYYLPGCFFCFNFEGSPSPAPVDPPFFRNGFVTFGCFGSHGKINRTLQTWWAEILRSVPESKLYVRNLELSSTGNIGFFTKQMCDLNIPAERLVVRGGLQRDALIACYQDVDISLDTWPYSGGNTLAESLWQGVPVVTYRGQRFSSSYGASLLQSSGCPELIAGSPEEYVRLAARLANDADRLKYYRGNLRNLTTQSGFNNAAAFATRLESAFSEMLKRAG